MSLPPLPRATVREYARNLMSNPPQFIPERVLWDRTAMEWYGRQCWNAALEAAQKDCLNWSVDRPMSFYLSALKLPVNTVSPTE